MAGRFYLATPQILTDTGRALAGGKIDFYENGTTTRKNTWSNVGLSVLNANPVVIGADGRVPDIFANASDVFSVRITDANDVVIVATIDDVSFVSALTIASADVIAALAANSAAVDIAGASMVGSAFGSFADDITLTAAGSIDASTSGAVMVLGTVNGTPTFSGVVTHGANVVSDTDSTDDLGTTSVRWLNLFVDKITLTGGAGSLTVDNSENTGILNAYGLITATTTVTGQGIASVSSSGTGIYELVFDDAADSTDEQAISVTPTNAASDTEYVANYEATSATEITVRNWLVSTPFNNFPIAIMRALFT
jgi:hypothetical protein